jgi:hypothetical protein
MGGSGCKTHYTRSSSRAPLFIARVVADDQTRGMSGRSFVGLNGDGCMMAEHRDPPARNDSIGRRLSVLPRAERDAPPPHKLPQA